MITKLAAFAITALFLSPSAAAQAQASSARDPFARIIARSDAVILGRVLDAGNREIPEPGSNGHAVTSQAFARIAVDRWIVGPDTDSTVDVRFGSATWSAEALRQQIAQPDRRVILYLLRSRGEWWLVREAFWTAGNSAEGVEAVSANEAPKRMLAILQEAAASSLDSLAAHADLAVVGSLDRFIDNPPGMICRVDRVVFGTARDSVLTVVTQNPGVFRRGSALLLLSARSDSTWAVLNDGAGCCYLDQERVARSTAPFETLVARVAAARARRAGGSAK